MFKIQTDPTFTADVKFDIAGKAKPACFPVEYKYLDQDQLKEYFGGLAGRTDLDALSEIVVGWKDVEPEYSETALKDLLKKFPKSAMGFFEAFRRETIGAKEKN